MPFTWISQDQHEVISFDLIQMNTFIVKEHNQPLPPQKIVKRKK